MQPPHFQKSKYSLTFVVLYFLASAASSDDNLKASLVNRISIFTDLHIGAEPESNSFLGVHSFWWEYPNGLTNKDNQGLDPLVKSFFQKTKGINRFGGGANEISWKTCTGDLKARQPVKAAPWLPPTICKFGIEDYVKSIETIGVKSSWMIANIAGVNHSYWSDIELMENMKFAAVNRKNIDTSENRFWELGNELDRGTYRWTPKKITERSNLAAAEINRADPAAKIIVPLIEFDAPQQPKREVFNALVISNLNFEADGFSLHMYYDGRPGGPPVSKNLDVIRETDRQIQKTLGQRKKIWITEHGRWPDGNHGDQNWKSSWHKTNDIDGVISTADFIIAASQLEAVGGLMLHGVRAGPWNIFRVESGRVVGLTGVGVLLEFLSHAFDGKRVVTKTESTNKSGYKGGYDIRGSAFVVGSMVHLIVANRAEETVESEINIVSSGGLYSLKSARNLSCQNNALYCQNPVVDDMNNRKYILNFDKNRTLVLEPKSVTHFSFELKRK